MNFDQTPEFAKELKKFTKKWRSLPNDLAILQKAVTALYIGLNGIEASHIRETFFATKKGAILTTLSRESEVVKIRLDCSDLNSDILRVVYLHNRGTIKLIELFAKNEKSREDTLRIKRYLSQ